MRVAVITCYKQPDYVRAVTLRSAVIEAGHECIVIKNRHLGLLRYPEVILKTIAIRIKFRPNAYLITFRGYEILPFINVLTWPKQLIFDEFINPLGWLFEPRKEKWVKFVPKKILRVLYKFLLLRPRVVLTDTTAHAAHSSQLTYKKPSTKKMVSIPVSTDESIFKPDKKTLNKNKYFKVFYYGNMLPLHGLEYVLEAATQLKDLPIEFVIVGGKSDTQNIVQEYSSRGAKIRYREWVKFTQLPKEIISADICLGGPFGDTQQAKLVITGKTYQFLACGAPTIIGKTLASDSFVDKLNCLIVPLGDSKSLANKILWSYKNKHKLHGIGDKGRLLYEKEFSIRAIAPQLESVLRMK